MWDWETMTKTMHSILHYCYNTVPLATDGVLEYQVLTHSRGAVRNLYTNHPTCPGLAFSFKLRQPTKKNRILSFFYNERKIYKDPVTWAYESQIL